MKVILADPPAGDRCGEHVLDYPNLGILYLIAALRQLGGMQVHYLKGHLTLEEHVREVRRIKPDLYGVSFASSYARVSYRVIHAVKSENPSLPIICGGAHPTAAPEDVFNRSEADICCLGEGERTIVELAQCWQGQKDLDTVAGIAYRRNGSFRKTVPRSLIEDLDHDLPMPAWDCVDFKEYLGCRKTKATPSTTVVASRGCPFDCVFCSNPVWKLHKPWVRRRSPQNIAAEVEYLYRRGIREIYLQSDEMNPDIRWCIDVFSALAKLGHPDLYYQCNLRATPITDELAETLRRANCWVVHLGIESGNQRVLDGIAKKVTLAEVERACQVLKRHQIKVFAFFMMYQAWEKEGRLRVETPREVNRSLWYILKLRMRNLIHYMSWGFATPYPGSQLFRVVEKYNLLLPSRRRHLRGIHDISLRLPGISRWRMAASRATGLLLQGMFVLSSREFYSRNTLSANVKQAMKMAAYILRPW